MCKVQTCTLHVELLFLLYCYIQCSLHAFQNYLKHGLHKAIRCFHMVTSLYFHNIHIKEKISKQRFQEGQEKHIKTHSQPKKKKKQKHNWLKRRQGGEGQGRMRTYQMALLFPGTSSVTAQNEEINKSFIWLGFNQRDMIHEVKVFVFSCK